MFITKQIILKPKTGMLYVFLPLHNCSTNRDTVLLSEQSDISRYEKSQMVQIVHSISYFSIKVCFLYFVFTAICYLLINL